MSDPKYEVRVMKKEEIPDALEIWKETGMQEGTHCVNTWLEVDPLGFWVAVTDSGEILGVCAAVFNNDDLAFVGFYVVREKYRGKGIGFAVWKACMNHVGDKNAALTAVPENLVMYRDKGGFSVEEPGWKNCVNVADKAVDPLVLLAEAPGVKIVKVDDAYLEMILDYDFQLIGYNRKRIISLTLKEEDSQSYVAVENGECVGYGTIKTSIQGTAMIGPLYSDSTEVAEVLLRNLILSLPNVKGFCMMTLSCNRGAKAIIGKLNVTLIEECPRIYTKRKVEIPDIDKVFGHLDLNFSPF